MSFTGSESGENSNFNPISKTQIAYEIAEAVNESEDLDKLFSQVHKLVNNYIPCKSFYIAIKDGESNSLTFPYFVNENEDALSPAELKKESNSIVRYAFEIDDSLLISETVLRDLYLSGKLADKKTSIKEWLGIPIKINGGKTAGFIALQNYSSEINFTGEHLRFLQFISTIIYGAIGKRLFKNEINYTRDKYNFFFESNPLMIFEVDTNGIVLDTNGKVKEGLKYESHELIGKNVMDVFHPDDRDTILLNIEECLLNEGITHQWELRKLTKEGEIVWVREFACAFDTKDGDKEILIVCENISNFKNAVDKIKENEEKYRLLAENTTDIIILHDLEGNIKYSNNAGIHLSEYKADEIEKIKISDLFDEEYLKRIQTFIKNKGLGDNLFIYDIDLKTKNGRKIPLEVNVSKLRQQKIKEELILVARDIRERKETEQSIREYNKELKRSNHAKDKFFSIIAHDLRSPFSALLSYSDIMIEEFDTLSRDEIKEYITHINNVSKNVFDLLNNLLDWSRVQTQNIYFEPELLDMKNTVQKVVDLYENMAKGKMIKVTTKLDQRVIAYADENMIYTVLRNLVSNALKFTDQKGNVLIEVKNKPDSIETSIKDDGMGMLEEDVKRLFRIDINYSTLGTNKERGTGLGLILVKELIDKNNGAIEVESRLGVGSTFKFTLPKKPT